ncbi:MAG TPA: hypothetical protein DEA50_02605 [Parvularcula sp.]|nr:hypothetical protein [Parvularcula sp.]
MRPGNSGGFRGLQPQSADLPDSPFGRTASPSALRQRRRRSNKERRLFNQGEGRRLRPNEVQRAVFHSHARPAEKIRQNARPSTCQRAAASFEATIRK